MIKQYKHLVHSTRHFENLNIQADLEYKHQHILSLEAFERAKKEITTWDNYKPTPLHVFSDMAKDAGVSSIVYKDENSRFSLKSFKALGGAYAVANLLIQKLKDIGISASSSDLIAGTYKHETSKITVCCATDGNHGRSVAWGALHFGCNCEIYIHRNVSVGRE